MNLVWALCDYCHHYARCMRSYPLAGKCTHICRPCHHLETWGAE